MIQEYPVTKMIVQLAADNLLPSILFRTSRRQCDVDIVKLARTRSALLPDAQQKALEADVSALIDKYQLERDVILGHVQYEALIQTGCGAHHAGQLLAWRLLLEELMTRSALRLMIATGTVAAGVDFPARSVIITAHSKRGNEGFNTLSASEFQQMSGRAGRRGKDVVGFCLVAPGTFSDARVIHEVSRQPPEPLRSAYFAAPSTILNLLKFRNVDDLQFTVERSLASFLDRKAAHHMRAESVEMESELFSETTTKLVGEAKKKAEKRVRRKLREAEEIEGRQAVTLRKMLEGLGRLGYVDEGKLTEKGAWSAALCTNLVLELGEAISSFLFADLTLEEVVGLVASIAGDPHRTYLSIKTNPIKSEYFKKIGECITRVRGAFETPPNSDIKVLPEAALTVMTWIDAESWIAFSGLLRLGGVAEGDAARLIMQTAEHLGQMARLRETHPDLAALCIEGRKRLLKPPLSEAVVAD